jgi:hypothetical protein
MLAVNEILSAFLINLPIGAITLFVMVFMFKSPHQDKGEAMDFKRRLQQFDLIGTVRSCDSLYRMRY